MSNVFATARLEARLSRDVYDLAKHAAELEHRTITDFAVAAVQDAARRVVESTEMVRLSMSDQEWKSAPMR